MMKRRQFLGEASCSALGSASVLSTLLNLKLANSLAAASPGNGADCKTLVCIFLHGGMDSYNFLVPTDEDRYETYLETRTNLALPQVGTDMNAHPNDQPPLIPLNQLPSQGSGNGDNLPYGIHYSCPGVGEMFNGTGRFNNRRRMSLVSNVGTLIEPVTKAQYEARSIPLPKALYSHSDQVEQWQTALPQSGTRLTGWAGRISDVLASTYNDPFTSMNISLDGNNLFQLGASTQPFVVTQQGALTYTGTSNPNPAHPLNLKNVALKNLVEREHANLVDQAFANVTSRSVEAQRVFQSFFSSFDETLNTPFPDSSFGRELFSALKTIFIRESLGLRRQTIFVSLGGWDQHGELLNAQRDLLQVFDEAIVAFQLALEQLNLADSTLTFTASDFARTLRSNGRGTDHAWGGNCMVFGGPVKGGRVYGTYPNLSLDPDNTDDTGRGGRIIPTSSCDKYFEPMMKWFGVSDSNLGMVLPNIANFSGSDDLNFIQ